MLLCIEYGILFVDTVNTKTKACNALNAIFVETVNTTVKTHPAHNFLNIQQIFKQMTYTFVLITSLIFNGFSIRKKF